MAHIGKDTYSHIHWDPDQARTISVREAARLQGFPDGFVFEGTMNPAFRQIGNAVAPLMAAAIAGVMLETLREATARLAAPLAA
jgi:DNA (cytosine-5)-methyltransferase 1